MKKFKKEVLRVGDFMTTDGVEFQINSGNLHQLAKTFSHMKENGVKVPVPAEHTNDPEKNRGWVDNIEVENESLMATMELSEDIDPDLYDVSVYIPSRWTDGEGHVYSQPIRHIALTSYPRITGLGEFQAIVASLVPVNGGKTMGVDFKKLGEDLGIESEMSEENAQELILSHVTSLGEKHQTEVDELKDQLENAKAPEKKSLDELKELAASHPGLITIGKKGREAKLDSMVGKQISPAVCDGLKELFCSDDAITLSLDESDDNNLFEKVCTVLEKNSLVDLKELTGPQGENLILSDPSKKKEGLSPLQEDLKRRREAMNL